jgi:hypothetical protein
MKMKRTTAMEKIIPLSTDSPASQSTQRPERTHTDTRSGNSIQSDELQKALAATYKNPRVSIYSHKSAAAFHYLKRVTPGFNASATVNEYLEERLKREFPDLWVVIEKNVDTFLLDRYRDNASQKT